MEKQRKPLSNEESRKLDKQRKDAVKQAQKYRKEQDKKAKKSSDMEKQAKKQAKSKSEKQNTKQTKKNPASKIEQAINSKPKQKREDISREEKFRREGKQKIRNLESQDFDGGYYVDEYGEKKRQEKRAEQIRKQENEVIRKRKKPLTPKQVKRRRIIFGSSVFLVVLIIGAVLSLTVLFKTENIVVEGDSYYYEEQITAFSNVSLQQNIFIAAFNSTPEEISKNLPYVESASVNFTIPDTITIKIKDAVPSYVVKNGDSFLLVSSKGRILDSITENKDGLPELSCEALKSTTVGDMVSFSDTKVPDILQSISESIADNEIDGITSIDVTSTANIKLEFDNRIEIKIGLPEEIDYKIRTAMAIINDKLDPNNTGTIAGTLDVSTCNTTKVSHYKPAESSASTQPSTTATDSTTYGTTYDSTYTWNSTDGANTTANDTYSYDSQNTYGGGTGYYSAD